MRSIKEKAEQAKEATIVLASLSEEKDNAIKAIAEALDKCRAEIIKANNKDMEEAEKSGLGEALLKRLRFDDAKIDELIEGLKGLEKIEDPVGKTLKATELDKGLELYRVGCPIGVIGIIFESRPDALVQISALCLKAGDSVLLKGGKEALNTNKALFELIKNASEQCGVASGWIQLLETREDVKEMLKLDDYIDLVVPRGSNEFVKYVMDNTKIPVLGHADGICHVYVDDESDIDMAVKVCYDSKCQYAAVCNAMETLLVNEKVAADFLPKLKKEMNIGGVKLLGDDKSGEIIDVEKASEKDWKTEYNDLTLSIKIVKDIDEAISHINKYGSGHTDAIVTKSEGKAKKFMQLVDSANVFWNCSTRFADGYRYGLGAEVGISTSKIHARGPVGVEGLLIYKWKLMGNGNIVADYSGKSSKKKFTHKILDKKFQLEEK